MKIIAYIETDFPEKFGIPRQSGLIPELKGRIVFTPEYALADAVKGLEDFNYIWLLWQFEEKEPETFRATCRPPRLGGNTTKGVFATRSPFRPNSIGLSSVRLERIEYTADGPVLHVAGADLRNHTPIYDIKPYLRYADSHPDATDGFAAQGLTHELTVRFADISYDTGDFEGSGGEVSSPGEASSLLAVVPKEKHAALIKVLSLDPRPSYQDDPARVYGLRFGDFNVKFAVNGDILTVTEITPV